MDKSADPIVDSLPSWLVPDPSPRLTIPTRRETDEAFYSPLFERALVGIAAGKPLSQTVEEYAIPVDYAHLLAWIHRDEARLARYREAQKIGAEVVADQMISIADASDSLEDVQRSTLRINTRKWLLGVWDRKRFGETRQIDQTVTVDMGAAMAEAMQRVGRARGHVIDVEPRMVK